MKGLEKLNDEKFTISQEELNQVKGGMAAAATAEHCPSYDYHYTGDSMDRSQLDSCTYYD